MSDTPWIDLKEVVEVVKDAIADKWCWSKN